MSNNQRPIMLITGASRGIGKAIALSAAKTGFNVCINYCNSESAAKAVLEEVRAIGVDAIMVKADISTAAEVSRLFEAVDSELGTLSVLVNNAGILDKSMQLVDVREERLHRVMNTNVIGSILCAQAAIKRMSTKHTGTGGSIINVSSRAAVLGAANEFVDYAASKGAIDTLTIGLSKEVAEEGIRVNAVRPGLIYSDIHTSAGDPGRVDRLQTTVPMQRGGSTEEVAQAVLWLATKAASYVTGSFIDVSGGR